jgi:hypothetical protein
MEFFKYMVMQSQEYTDLVIEELKQAAAAGYDKEEALEKIFNHYKISNSDFTLPDKKRLERAIERIYIDL